MPLVATPISRLLWNQPRNWSPPSRYISAGQRPGLSSSMEAMWVLPESNQPSRVSVSLVKCLPPQCGQAKPSGRSSAASSSNQALEPFSRKILLTDSIVSSVQTGLPQSEQ